MSSYIERLQQTTLMQALVWGSSLAVWPLSSKNIILLLLPCWNYITGRDIPIMIGVENATSRESGDRWWLSQFTRCFGLIFVQWSIKYMGWMKWWQSARSTRNVQFIVGTWIKEHNTSDRQQMGCQPILQIVASSRERNPCNRSELCSLQQSSRRVPIAGIVATL